MPEVSGVGGGNVSPQGQSGGVTDRGAQVTPVNQTAAQAEGLPGTVGQPGPLGQPTGLPAPPLPAGASALPDVLAGRDPSQFAAAEQMRARGGASATEALLGLDRQPTQMGALAAPPGNSEALRHMTPTMRRAAMRGLLDKQRERMRRLALALRRDPEGDEREGDSAGGDGRDGHGPAGFAAAPPPLDDAQLERARLELGSAAQMLDLLDELLAMQDYAISQMGTFSRG